MVIISLIACNEPVDMTQCQEKQPDLAIGETWLCFSPKGMEAVQASDQGDQMLLGMSPYGKLDDRNYLVKFDNTMVQKWHIDPNKLQVDFLDWTGTTSADWCEYTFGVGAVVSLH